VRRSDFLWLLLGLVLLALSLACAVAKPPDGADPDSPLAHWYQSLAQPETGYPCCSVADCRTVQYRTAGDHFEAFIDRKSFGTSAPDDWLPVPSEHVLHRHDNPTGEAVVCWYNGEIRCFVEGSGI
jgi:hypothetical protein